MFEATCLWITRTTATIGLPWAAWSCAGYPQDDACRTCIERICAFSSLFRTFQEIATSAKMSCNFFHGLFVNNQILTVQKMYVGIFVNVIFPPLLCEYFASVLDRSSVLIFLPNILNCCVCYARVVKMKYRNTFSDIFWAVFLPLIQTRSLEFLVDLRSNELSKFFSMLLLFIVWVGLTFSYIGLWQARETKVSVRVQGEGPLMRRKIIDFFFIISFCSIYFYINDPKLSNREKESRNLKYQFVSSTWKKLGNRSIVPGLITVTHRPQDW